MNAAAWRFLIAVLGLATLCLVLSLLLKREVVERIRASASWLLRVSFLDLVKMVIFVKPWKAHVEQVGAIVWLILAYMVGNYMIGASPTTTEIPGEYIPMIGYVYYISALYVGRFALGIIGSRD